MRCLGYGMFGIWNVQYVGMFQIWDDGDDRCLGCGRFNVGCRMFAMCDVQNVGCLIVYGLFIESLGCGMLRL